MKKPFVQRIWHHLHRMLLHPIRVFVFHQVSDVFDPELMWECDWTQTEAFKRSILNLKKHYIFISLVEAQNHLMCDRIRRTNYAVLTADDGWESLKNILPWLVEQRVPITLFLNPLYLDGEHKQSRGTERFLREEEVSQLVEEYAPYISIASHGWTHEDCTAMNLSQFQEHVMKAEQALGNVFGKVPFYAFAWGKHKKEQVDYLRSQSLVSVFVDGMLNVDDSTSIHRECIDGKVF